MLENFKLWLGNHTSHNWIENHLLYFGILFAVIIVILSIIILIKWQKDINKMNKASHKSIIELLRETSLKRKKERKQLKF